MHGLRVHLSGSATRDCSAALLSSAHAFVRYFVQQIVARGGGLVLGAGDEPRQVEGSPCIFDWVALEVIAGLPDPAPAWPTGSPKRFVAVATQRGLEKVPPERAAIWKRCVRRSDFHLSVAPPGWRMAGLIRQRQLLFGGILVTLGGGAGTEQLAERYREDGKPVIPIDSGLGALNNDGNGGSRFLHQQALSETKAYFRLRDGAGSAAARLSSLRLKVDGDVDGLAQDVVKLLVDLRPPAAFYVRLLSTDHPDYAEVEHYFRGVVDAVIADAGFAPREMGREKPERAFMNVEIFEALHRAGLVVVDLTGVRPNCMMELGYALGRGRRVIITARNGTDLPFDEDKLPTHLWDPGECNEDRVHRLKDWVQRYSELPPIVE